MNITDPQRAIRGTILAIDDNPNVLDLVQRGLARRGFNVVTTTRGAHALQLLPQIRPNLILCDVSMPRMDGYEVLAGIKAHPEWQAIPFVFLTAFADHKHIRRGMIAGAHDYITKPFSLKEVEATINTQLQRVAQQRRHVQAELDDLRGKIAHSLPHELRTPLHIIKGYSELLMDEIHEETESFQTQMLTTIQSYSDRMQHIIENFLLYSQLMIKPESITDDKMILPDVQDSLTEAANRIASHYERADDLELTLQSASLHINPVHLNKIIREIVDNAFKFSEAGTPVRIITCNVEDEYHIYITDHGRGLTPKQLQAIGAYMQFDRRIYEQQGTGLGLVLAKLLTEAYCGNLEISSKPDSGTQIHIILKTALVTSAV